MSIINWIIETGMRFFEAHLSTLIIIFAIYIFLISTGDKVFRYLIRNQAHYLYDTENEALSLLDGSFTLYAPKSTPLKPVGEVAKKNPNNKDFYRYYRLLFLYRVLIIRPFFILATIGVVVVLTLGVLGYL